MSVFLQGQLDLSIKGKLGIRLAVGQQIEQPKAKSAIEGPVKDVKASVLGGMVLSCLKALRDDGCVYAVYSLSLGNWLAVVGQVPWNPDADATCRRVNGFHGR
jgi:hypothetical protein